MTNTSKWDDIGFSHTKTKVRPLLIEFSGGIEYKNSDSKKLKDLNKLIPGAIKSIEHICAISYLQLPIPEFIVRFYDGHIKFESVLKLSNDLYVRRTYVTVPVPKTIVSSHQRNEKMEDKVNLQDFLGESVNVKLPSNLALDIDTTRDYAKKCRFWEEYYYETES